jgi:hypothetical protein
MKTFLEYVQTIILEKAGNIESIIDNNDLMLFFKTKNEYFGGTEESRVVFARMKNPTSDNPAAWRKEASFSALNISKAVQGEKLEQVFGFKDLKSIKIVPKEDVIKALNKKNIKQIDIKPDSVDKIPSNMSNIEDDA